MATLPELKKSILDDGKIDANEVEQIKELIFKDGVVDLDEADFVFDLNSASSDLNNASTWQPLFIETISSYLLNDEKSPNIIDEGEASWLISKIGEDGKVDINEKALLTHLKAKAQSIPSTLAEYINRYA